MKILGKVTSLLELAVGISSIAYSQEPIPASMPDTAAENGVTISISVQVGELTGRNVIAYQTVINFDKNVLDAIGATSAGTLSEAFGQPTVNLDVDGQISLGGFGTAPLSGSGTLVKLNFKVVGQPGQETMLTFSEFTFNNGIPAAVTSGGTLKVVPARPPIKVYVMSCGNSADDQTVLNALTGQGFLPTLGAQPHEWNGKQARLNDFNAVVLLNSHNWSRNSMPDSGQIALLNYVNAGGGVVTGEWFVWNVSLGGRHKNLAPMTPAAAVGDKGPAATTTYVQVTADSILNKGLPSAFDFALNIIGGSTESFLSAKVGATVFYHSTSAGHNGLVGWNYGAGRVISFSTFISDVELANPNYAKLFVNTVERAGTFAPIKNQLPIVANRIPGTTLTLGGVAFTRDLNAAPAVFTDPNQDTLTYTVDSSTPNKVMATLSNSRLTIIAVDTGKTMITITADDRRGGTASTSFLVTVIAPSALAKVYVMSSGNSKTDQTVINVLSTQALLPTLGVQPHEWDGTQANLLDFNVVVLLNSHNHDRGTMPEIGQTGLLNYVTGGGGVVTGEWLVWNVDLGSRHRNLAPLMPAHAVGFQSARTPSAIYAQVTADPVINNGLPPSFDFPLNYLGGAESFLEAKNGATVFYHSSGCSHSGLIGWKYGVGRVISFSTLITDLELANPDYARLFLNTVNWAGAIRPMTNPDPARNTIRPSVSAFRLDQNYPNPSGHRLFNTGTLIKYQIPQAGQVVVKIYNSLGREVRTLVNEIQPAGRYEITWNGRDERGQAVPSGTYFYRLQARAFAQTRKLILLK